MAKATDQQVQDYANARIRVRCEQIRDLLIAMEDDKSAIDDVYAAMADSPTWEDTRSDGPPHLLTPGDVLAWNTFLSDMITAMRGNAQLPIILKSCVRPVGA